MMMSNKICDIAFDTIKTHNLIQKGDTVIVACSGGADSVALLHFLCSKKNQLCINVCALHVNHNLRGQNSDGDADFVRNFCSENDIILHEIKLDSMEDTSENALRQKRYSFFEHVKNTYKNAKIATAHTQNDNAETLILHITRGAGLQGACGIQPKRDYIIRPFINITRAQIEEYLAANGQKYRDDESNNTLVYARNKVRHSVMPPLLSINDKACEAMERFTKAATEANDYILCSAKQLLKSAEIKNKLGEKGYDVKVLANAHAAVLKAAMHTLISPHADATQKRIELCINALVKASGGVELSKNAAFTAAQGFAHIIEVKNKKNTDDSAYNQGLIIGAQAGAKQGQENLKNDDLTAQNRQVPCVKTLVDSGETHVFLGEYELVFSVANCEETVNFKEIQKKHLKYFADYGKIKYNVALRTKTAGDKFCAVGGNITKPLKKIYSEARLSEHLRSTNPILAHGSDVVWVCGFGFTKSAQPTAETKQILTIEVKNNRG